MILLKAGAELFDLGRLSSPRYFLDLEAVQVVSKIVLFAGRTFEIILPVSFLCGHYDSDIGQGIIYLVSHFSVGRHLLFSLFVPTHIITSRVKVILRGFVLGSFDNILPLSIQLLK